MADVDVAALYVQPNGAYRGVPGVWMWDEKADARKKATWLYVVGLPADQLPELRWGSDPNNKSTALVSWCGNRVSAGMMGRPRVGKDVASRTPDEFRDVLLGIARQVQHGL